MITILKEGYAKILKLFYNDKTKKLHLREIARQTKLHEPSVSRFLNNLEKENILKSEKEANLKNYRVRYNKKAYLIFEIFDIQKYEKLPHIRKTAITCYLNNLPQEPIFSILFGSTAKENYNKSSDIDILIITNTKIDTKKAEYEADSQSAMKISTFQMTYPEFLKELKLKEDKVIQSALKTGYPLINHIKYYEVLYNETI